MKTLVQFRHFDGATHIKEYVERSVRHILGKFETRTELDARVILGKARARTEFHNPIYECEVFLNDPRQNKPVVVKKASRDFYKAVSDCVEAAEKILRRVSRVRVSRRKAKTA